MGQTENLNGLFSRFAGFFSEENAFENTNVSLQIAFTFPFPRISKVTDKFPKSNKMNRVVLKFWCTPVVWVVWCKLVYWNILVSVDNNFTMESAKNI